MRSCIGFELDIFNRYIHDLVISITIEFKPVSNIHHSIRVEAITIGEVKSLITLLLPNIYKQGRMTQNLQASCF